MEYDKEIRAYVRQYYEDGRLQDMSPFVVMHCMVKGFIQCCLLHAGYPTVQLSTLGETWLYHTDTPDAGKRAIGTDTGDGGSVEHPEFKYAATSPDGLQHWYRHAESVVASDFTACGREIDGAYPVQSLSGMQPCPACLAAQATPQADSEATGYRVGQSLLAKDKYDVEYFDGRIRTVAYELEQTHARYIMQILADETSHLRAENARLQKAVDHSDNSANMNAKKVIDLRAELKAARDEIAINQSAMRNVTEHTMQLKSRLDEMSLIPNAGFITNQINAILMWAKNE